MPPVAAQGMGLHVTLCVFSGCPNPEWDLMDTDNRSNNRILHLVNKAEGGKLPSILGYQGFIVRVMFGLETVKNVTVPRRTNRPLELALLDSAPRHLVTGLIPGIREDINAQG